jgi:hypothetical protein
MSVNQKHVTRDADYSCPCLLVPAQLKGTVSPDFQGFFMTYNINSVLSAWALMVFKFFYLVVILIF